MHGLSLGTVISGVQICIAAWSLLQFDPNMVEAKPGAEKDAEGEDDPSKDAAPAQPTGGAQPMPGLPATGEVTAMNTHALCSHATLGKVSAASTTKPDPASEHTDEQCRAT